jgi:hypothetical protein
MNLKLDAPSAMRSPESNMATKAKNSFLPRKILLSSNLGGVAPASKAFSDRGAGLDFSRSTESEDQEMERDLRMDAREGVAVRCGQVVLFTLGSFTPTEGDLYSSEVMVSYLRR